MIVDSLLIAAPMLQDYLIGKDNLSLSAGKVICWEDGSRTTLKNWYYQTGTPGNYSFLPLQNPMTLSAAGTIVDVNGYDTIPFFYPYSETDNITVQKYFIQVFDSNGEFQFSRANFPYNGVNGGPDVTGTDIENIIVNGRFWRNIGSALLTGSSSSPKWTYQYQTGSPSSVYYTTVAPSQHDGFSMPDMNYIKNIIGATESVTFMQFPLGSTSTIDGGIDGDITPEYYLNHNCSGVQSGETLKCYQIPISLHVKTLESLDATLTIQMQSVSGANTVTFGIYQFLGSGVVSETASVFATEELSTAWTKYTVPFTFPSADGAVLGTGEDDALYLQIGLPTGAAFVLNFTLPSIYLSDVVPDNNFQTYDQIDSVIGTPRTGDIRTSLNTFYPFGWTPMNDGIIGYALTGLNAGLPLSRNNKDTWPLFNLIWNSFAQFSTGSSASGTNLIAQMYTKSGTAVGYGPNVTSPTTAISDWNANNFISLTKQMARVIMGSVPVSALTGLYSTTFTASGNVITTANTVNFFNGMPLYVTGTTTLTPYTIYYVTAFNTSNNTQFNLSTNFAQSITGTPNVTVASDSGTVVADLAGSFNGEYSKLIFTNNNGARAIPTTTSSTANVADISQLQSATFMNMYMKL